MHLIIFEKMMTAVLTILKLLLILKSLFILE